MNMRSQNRNPVAYSAFCDCLHAINRICHACASNFGKIIPSYLLIALFFSYLVDLPNSLPLSLPLPHNNLPLTGSSASRLDSNTKRVINKT